jgi:hypothetical protein
LIYRFTIKFNVLAEVSPFVGAVLERYGSICPGAIERIGHSFEAQSVRFVSFSE